MKTIKPVGTATKDSLETLSAMFIECGDAVAAAKEKLARNYPHARDYADNHSFYSASNEWLARVSVLDKLARKLHSEGEALAQ